MTEGALTEAGTPRIERVLAPNPGPMTLEGTNSYLIGSSDDPSAPRIVVDPGPLDADHLARLTTRPVALIVLTHHHPDHSEAAPALARLSGAPVRAADPGLCIDAEPLLDEEWITAAGVRLRVLRTPGHTADSLCLHLSDVEGGSPGGAVLTGDTVLGRGTSIIAHPDGALGAYLASLERLRALGPARVLPGHGPELPDLAAICDAYLAHRAGRLAEVRSALDRLGDDASAEAVTDLVYAGTDPAVRPAAEASMRAQLAFLRGEEHLHG